MLQRRIPKQATEPTKHLLQLQYRPENETYRVSTESLLLVPWTSCIVLRRSGIDFLLFWFHRTISGDCIIIVVIGHGNKVVGGWKM